jgi:flagellin-specific chaperone FliS
MSDGGYTLTQSWPVIKEDLMSFLSDTDAWIIEQLKEAYVAKDWEIVHKVIDIMESVHNLSHSH